jgi:NADPH:quinone reductase-like Zn-dependent oxidoreductase
VSQSYGPVDQLEVAEVPTPVPGPGQLLVRVRATALNPLDIKLVTGAMKEFMPVQHPFILGFDAAGTVEAVGAGVTGYAPGDEVVAFTDQAVAEYTAVDAGPSVAHRPADVDIERAAALPVAALTALQLVETAKLGPGKSVLVVGATGGVGTYAVQLAAQTGADVWATARPDEADFVRGLGAAHAVDYTATSVAEAVGDGVDVVIDLVNAGPGVLAAAARPGGRVVSPLGGPESFDRDVTATYQRTIPTEGQLQGLLDAVAAGTLAVEVGGTYPFAESPQAVADFVAKHRRGKTVITF